MSGGRQATQHGQRHRPLCGKCHCEFVNQRREWSAGAESVQSEGEVIRPCRWVTSSEGGLWKPGSALLF